MMMMMIITMKNSLVVSDESMYRLSEKVNRRNLGVWDSENSQEKERDSPNIKVVASMSREDLNGPFFSQWNRQYSTLRIT